MTIVIEINDKNHFAILAPDIHLRLMKKILIIEDNTDVRENLQEILGLSGYEAVVAENGKVGVEKAQSFLPDLILCDKACPAFT